MTATRIVEVVLLTVGVSVELVCSIGVLVTRDALNRLHFVSPAGIIGAVPLLVAVALEGSVSHAARTAFVGAVLIFASPFVNRAIARALHVREVGRFRIEARPPRREGDER